MATPPRLAVVWCPDWPVTAAGVRADESAAVLHANRVVAVSAAARAAGVRPGQRRREAQARCPALAVLAHDPARDARAFDVVLQAMGTLTPLVEHTRPGLATFATRGPSRYHGGDEALAARAASLAAAALGGGPVGVGVADGRFAAVVAARAAARSGARTPVVVAPGRSPAYLAPLPVAALDLPEVAPPPGVDDLPGLVDLLGRLGIATLGDLAALAPADVVARFGPAGWFAHRLAAGLDDRPPGARRPPPDLAVQAEFEPPVAESGPVAFAAKQLADELRRRLADLGLACTRLAVLVESEHGERHERCWGRDGAFTAAAMVERVRWQLDGWAQGPAAPTGGIARVRLAPDEVVPDTGRQTGFWGGTTRADERAARAADRLVALLGPTAVTVPEWRGGRDPGAAVVAVPAASVELDGRSVGPAPSEPWPGRLPGPAPASVLAEPVPAEVLDAGGRVVGVSGRALVSGEPAVLRVGGGRPRPVVGWAGPWPVDERWWDARTHRRRARFQLLTADGVAVLAAVEGGRWWVEAVYD